MSSSNMEFSKALALISQLHEAEVQRLRSRINELTEAQRDEVKPERAQNEQLVASLERAPSTADVDAAQLNAVMIKFEAGSERRETIMQCAKPFMPFPRSIGDLPAINAELSDDSPLFVDRIKNTFGQGCTGALDKWLVLLQRVLYDCVQFDARPGWSATEGAALTVGREGRDKTFFEEVLNKMDSESMFTPLRSTISLAFSRPSSFRVVMHPSSKRRIFWILFCLVLLMIEVILVTMAPFGIADAGWAMDLDVCFAAFWTFDILVNFLSGVYIHGRAEVRFRIVAEVYLRSWFFFDGCVVACQWLSILNTMVSSVGTGGFLVKAVRVIRFLRLAKISSLLDAKEMASSVFGANGFRFLRIASFSSKVAKFVFAAMLFLHCVSCLWYEVGRATDGWVFRHADILKGEVGHDYLVALHFSLSQFQGNVDIYPGPSTVERAFVCVSSVISIICLALFLGSLTELLVSISEERKRRDHELRKMGQFLHAHALPPKLLARAKHHLKIRKLGHALSLKERIDEESLQLFPSPLKEQMRAELLACEFSGIAVLTYLRCGHEKAFVALCECAVTNRTFAPQDDLFISADHATHLHVVVTGDLTYDTSMNDDLAEFVRCSFLQLPPSATGTSAMANIESERSAPSLSGQQAWEASRELKRRLNSKQYTVASLGKSDVVSEAALWMSFHHEGDLRSSSYGQILLVSGTAFVECVTLHELPFKTLSNYAHRFVHVVVQLKNSDKAQHYIDLIDTWRVGAEERKS